MTNIQSHIDTRLFPLSIPPKVRLYSEQEPADLCISGNGSTAIKQLQQITAGYFQVDAEQVFPAESGSSALVALLSFLRQTEQGTYRIAVPSYSCIELASAIVSADYEPVLLDLNSNMSFSRSSIEFAINQKCSIIVWPNFFGFRERDRELLDLCAESGMFVILDEAQSFPVSAPYAEQLIFSIAALVSFGKSKRVGASRGGALIVSSRSLAVKLREFHGTVSERQDRNSTFNMPIFHNLNTLVEQKGLVRKRYVLMQQDNAIEILGLLSEQPEYETRLQNLYCTLTKAVVNKWGETSLELLKGLPHTPTISAFKVSAKWRFEIMKELGEHAIQSTWYYWPLHLQSYFKDAIKEEQSNTESLASQILILPCQSHHNLREIKLICNAINRC